MSKGVAPDQISIRTKGMTFGALAWGESDAPVALLLHGYPDTAWTWRYLGPHLAALGWRAVAPFTRGYGPSDLAPDDSYLVADLVDDVLAIADALDADERAVLVGHDWGAVTTWGVTEREPGRFASHVALAVPPTGAMLRPFASIRTLPIGLRQARMSWYFLYNQLPGFAERGLDRVIPRLWRDWSPRLEAKEDLARVFCALDSPERRRAALRYYRCNLQQGLRATFSIRPGAPTLYLHGEEDGCIHPALIDLAGDLLPSGSRVERLAAAGHFLHLEDPARVNRAIGRWVGPAPRDIG